MADAKEIAQQQIAAAFAQDWGKLETLYAESVRYVDPDGEWSGREAAIAHLRDGLGPMPDASYKINAITGAGEVVTVEWTCRGTNTGPLPMPDGTTLPATGKSLVFNVATVYETKDGQIVSERNYWDNMTLYAQLGLLPE